MIRNISHDVIEINMQSDDLKTITGAQIRAARALLKMSAEDLAKAASVGVATVRRAEGSDGDPNITAANNFAVKRYLEAAGIVFIPENGGGAGVRLKKTE